MTADDWVDRPGFDCWAELPDDLRAEVLAAGTEGWKSVFHEIATYNETWKPLRPVLVRRDWLDRLYGLSDRMLQLVLECCLRRARTAGELRKLLGIPDGRVEFLDDDELLGEHLVTAGRPDVLLTGGVPKFVEFNIGSDVGSVWDSEQVSERFLQLLHRHELADRLAASAPPSAVDARYAAVGATLGLAERDRLTMLFRTDGEYPESHDPARLVELLEPFAQRGRDFGYAMDVLPVDWLELDADDRLIGRIPSADGTSEVRQVEAILRLFVCSQMPPTVGLQAIKDALRAGTASLFTSAASWLLSNKVVFAWLWEDADRLPAADAELIRTHLPRTSLLTASNRLMALADRKRLVLKPADEFGGEGVLVGREQSPDDWAAAIDRGVADGSHLLQEYSRPDRLLMDFVHLESGRVEQAEIPFSIGPYSFGRRGAGCYVRIGSQDEGEVLNLKRNVHVTGALVLDAG
ncbi:protein of unknown function DUF407 [Kribbella flavida DSM 17836]|uniref:Circularly permuted ATPgrasp domain-containing protein n=1 Tax=Kribbella flavida (strain DSM 17836 / JCM 10339 / NBRC 14399) TaxID=479435 RepID=D2PT10_KRIFD|nr:hypothetical protein [Kribbella flavida]ADB35062.1 protein of unknown function DUF407 [Kribbella flavida DSM 17836]